MHGIAKNRQGRIEEFVNVIDEFIKLRGQLNLYERARLIANELGYLDSLAKKQNNELFASILEECSAAYE